MLKRFKMDLHIHSCLSPCGDLGMLPGKLTKEARKKGLDAIGISDHNSAENVIAVRKAAQKLNIAVIGGIEVTSSEEVHILAYFDYDESLFEFQRIIYENLPGVNDVQFFGEQILANENDEVIGVNDRLLIGATELAIDEIVDIIHSLNGLAIAAHIDRERFSIIGQLGFIPKGLALDAVEVSPEMLKRRESPDFIQAHGFPALTSSDAHYIEDIGRSSTTFFIEKAKVSEIKKALHNEDGRYIITYSGYS